MIQGTGICCIVILDTDTLQDSGYRVFYSYQDTDTLQEYKIQWYPIVILDTDTLQDTG